MSVVLVVNSGSSSFKYQLLDMTREEVLASGLVERIGEGIGVAKHTVAATALADPDGPAPTATDATYTIEREIPDHTAGFAVMLDAFAARYDISVELVRTAEENIVFSLPRQLRNAAA